MNSKQTGIYLPSLKRLWCLIMLAAAPCFLMAQTDAPRVWSLEDCIQYAWDNNLQVKQQQLSTQLSKLQYDQSIANLFPNINGTATHVYNYGQTLDLYTNEFASNRVQSNNFAVTSNVVLFSALQMLNNLMQKRTDFLASRYDLEQMKNDIALTLATAYLQILYNIEVLAVAESQLELTQQQVERMKKLLAAETVTKGSLLTLEAQQAGEEMSVVNARNQLKLSYLTLVQMLDLPSAEGFEIVKPALVMPEASALLVSPQEVYNKSLETQPAIKAANLRITSAKKGVNMAYGALSPTLSLSGSWGTGYSGASKEASVTPGDPVLIGYTYPSLEEVYGPSFNYTYSVKSFGDQISDNQNKSFGLYLNVPIFNRWQVQTGISSAKIQYKMAELNYQTTASNLNKTIQQAHADALAALERYNAALKSVDAYQEAFVYTKQKYDVGLLNAIDYNDASTKLAKAKSDLLQSRYEFVFRVKVLDFYQGKPLNLN